MPLDASTLRVLEEADYMDLTTTGRKSKKPRTVELSFAVKGEEILCLAGSGGKVDWYQNLRRDPNVSIKVGNTRLKGKAKPISGNTKKAVERIVALFRNKYGADYVREWYSGTERAPVRVRIRR
jgi:deazaflavin-dependent oxidoreductase (nitroreductase family)